MEDEDEVLMALSESLHNFVEYIGGIQHFQVLFSINENLCKVEESCIREKAA